MMDGAVVIEPVRLPTPGKRPVAPTLPSLKDVVEKAETAWEAEPVTLVPPRPATPPAQPILPPAPMPEMIAVATPIPPPPVVDEPTPPLAQPDLSEPVTRPGATSSIPSVEPVLEPVDPSMARRSWPVAVARAQGREALQDRLLSIMDRKDHWAWSHITQPGLSSAQLHAHYRHEYLTYVRDFPVLLARLLGKGPPAPVRKALAANIFEEQTGGLSFGVSHPDLFLEMMGGLGFDRRTFEGSEGSLEPEALHYRGLLEQVTAEAPWVVGAAVLTIFVEGSVHERAELAGRRVLPPIEDVLRAHPLVAHYGCPPGCMRLTRAHRAVEAGHRADAWAMVLDHAGDNATLSDAVISAVDEAHLAWLAYRDGVARAMGLTRPR